MAHRTVLIVWSFISFITFAVSTLKVFLRYLRTNFRDRFDPIKSATAVKFYMKVVEFLLIA